MPCLPVVGRKGWSTPWWARQQRRILFCTPSGSTCRGCILRMCFRMYVDRRPSQRASLYRCTGRRLPKTNDPWALDLDRRVLTYSSTDDGPIIRTELRSRSSETDDNSRNRGYNNGKNNNDHACQNSRLLRLVRWVLWSLDGKRQSKARVDITEAVHAKYAPDNIEIIFRRRRLANKCWVDHLEIRWVRTSSQRR